MNRTDVPIRYQKLYARAMRGKSRNAAIRAFCCECCGWEIKEVYLCTDLGCPLYPYRPRARIYPGACQGGLDGAESINSGQGVSLVGSCQK